MIAGRCTIEDVIQHGLSRAARAWRPQSFGRARARDIRDPLIEPLWSGDRVLVHVEAGDVAIVDARGESRTEGLDAVTDAIRSVVRAGSLVLDGYLTTQASRPQAGMAWTGPEMPSAGEVTAQMLIGGRGRNRNQKKSLEVATPRPDPEAPLAFVAIDLLALDDEPLLDVPLLERKRLLESVLDEAELVRRSVFVRPPIAVWLNSWRALGFTAVAFKSANGRYEPGIASDGWAMAPIPDR